MTRTLPFFINSYKIFLYFSLELDPSRHCEWKADPKDEKHFSTRNVKDARKKLKKQKESKYSHFHNGHDNKNDDNDVIKKNNNNNFTVTKRKKL